VRYLFTALIIPRKLLQGAEHKANAIFEELSQSLEDVVSARTEASYMQELASSRPYQTTVRDYDSVEVVSLENIVFPNTREALQQLRRHQDESSAWEQADNDSSEEPELISEDISSSTSWGQNVRSISASFDDDNQTVGDEDFRKVIKDIVIYDEAGGTHRLVCLLDTGATLDCISKTKVSEIRYNTWMRKLKLPLHVPVGGNQTTCIKYVVKAAWQFLDGKATYRQKLHVTDLDNLPYDIILSRRTIFQFEFLVSTMDCSSTLDALDGIDALLPLGLSRLSRGKVTSRVNLASAWKGPANVIIESLQKQEEEAKKKAASNKQQTEEDFEKTKREAEAKKKAKQEARTKASAQAQQVSSSS
jgi:hypothetical protein